MTRRGWVQPVDATMQPTDVFSTFTDKDFLLGLNAALVTLSGIAKLAGVTIAR